MAVSLFAMVVGGWLVLYVFLHGVHVDTYLSMFAIVIA